MKKFTLALLSMLIMIIPVLGADSATVNLSFTIPAFLSIKPLSSPVLLANVTDRTGNLYQPLSVTYRVISNRGEGVTLFLRGVAHTEDGEENAMFTVGGQVYLAFTYIDGQAKHSALQGCKIGYKSPKVIAYPIVSVRGAENKYSKGRYEVFIKNGTYDITTVVGTHVLPSSFEGSDPKGFYKATVLLTETDI